jgi:hypothetical protein
MLLWIPDLNFKAWHGMACPTLYMPCMQALEALGLLSFSLELGREARSAQVTLELYPFLKPSRKYRYETFELGSCKLIHEALLSSKIPGAFGIDCVLCSPFLHGLVASDLFVGFQRTGFQIEIQI